MPKCNDYTVRKVYITADIYFIKDNANVGDSQAVRVKVECIRNNEAVCAETKKVMIDIKSDPDMIKSYLHNMAFHMISEMTFKHDMSRRMWVDINWNVFKAGGYSDELRDS